MSYVLLERLICLINLVLLVKDNMLLCLLLVDLVHHLLVGTLVLGGHVRVGVVVQRSVAERVVHDETSCLAGGLLLLRHYLSQLERILL